MMRRVLWVLVICLWGLGKFRICILCCLQLIVCGNCVQECEAARMRPCAKLLECDRVREPCTRMRKLLECDRVREPCTRMRKLLECDRVLELCENTKRAKTARMRP